MFAQSPQQPGTRTRLAGAIGAVVTAGAFLAIPVSGVTASAASWCAPTGTLSVDALPSTVSPADCDLTGRTVSDGAVRVDVPAPGNGVSAAGRGAAGESALQVFTDVSGLVTIVRDEHGAAALPTRPVAAVAKSAACRDSAYSGMGYKFSGTFVWVRNPAGTPKNISSTAGAAIAQTTSDITHGLNRCGYKKTVRLGQRYQGLTTRKPQITASGSCFSAGDGVSVTGWLKLPKVLAYTCSYYRKLNGKWVVSESDMALSTSFKWFTSSVPRGCTYSFDLRGVVAHERGHTFGLGHVKNGSALTMAPYSQPCTTANRALGYGDYRGLSTMYGVS